MAESGPLPWPPAREMPEAPGAGVDASPWLSALGRLLDPLMLALTLLLSAWLWGGGAGAAVLVLALLAFLLALPAQGSASLAAPLWLAHLLVRWCWMAGALAALGWLTGYLAVFDARMLGHWLWMAPGAQIAARLVLHRVTPGLARLHGPPRPAVIVGLNAQGTLLAQRLARSPLEGIELLGFFDDRLAERGAGAAAQSLKGGLRELSEYVKRYRVQLIYLSLPMSSSPRILQVLDDLKDTTASIYFVPDMFITDLIQGRSDKVGGVTVISVCDTPFRGWAGVRKRGSDIVLAALILVLIAPLMGLVALAVRLDSSGPVIFRQRRYGLDGQQIWVYKFRSMRVTEDGDQIRQAQRGDDRVTRVGAFLRRTSLDELPQFINVLQGRMSIVGPRPHAVAHNELYRKLIKGYMVRHKVKPGITGWAQVNGQRGETDTLAKMQARIALDLDYLRHWSLGLDLRIIARTVILVFKDVRAY
jgi:putative colanic acid biosynthesis UDP-glucose lipid carrier transferase